MVYISDDIDVMIFVSFIGLLVCVLVVMIMAIHHLLESPPFRNDELENADERSDQISEEIRGDREKAETYVSELPQRRHTVCHTCGRAVSESEEKCPYCGASVNRKETKRVWGL